MTITGSVGVGAVNNPADVKAIQKRYEAGNEKRILSGIVIFVAIFTCKIYAADDCSKKTSDSEIFTCAKNKRNNAEKQLNNEYAEAKKRINDVFSEASEVKKDYLATFIDSQRGWVKYRDAQCQLFAHVADKNSNPYIVFTNNCVARLDEQRSKQLKEIPYD